MDQEDIPLDPSTLIRLGTIASVDLEKARCTVRFGIEDEDDGGATTPPIRWLAVRAGRTRRWSAPSKDEECLLLCPDGQIGNGVALVGLYNANNPAPADDERDVAVFADGARIGYDPVAHVLSALLPAGAAALIEAPGGLTIRGPVAIEGQVTVTGKLTASEDVIAAGKSLKGHKHSGVQAGAAQSGAPV